MLIFTFIALHSLASGIPLDDPSKWPGHLENFGSKQNVVAIEDVLYAWPSPQEFYKNYVDQVKPVHLRGVYRHSDAVRQWTDHYLLSYEEARHNTVMVEPSVIENRTAPQKRESFHQFLSNYHDFPILTFSDMPSYLRKDVTLPPPLRCNETTKHLVNANIVMSQGNARSHVYNDDVETIYCSIRGNAEFLLIEYNKNKRNVIDKPQGGYSTVDVQRVDYVKYPKLRNIDAYIKVALQPGDCLYIPYRWYKQSNSYSNEAGQSIALNIWFKHLHDHKPVCDDVPDSKATLDKYHYSDQSEDEEDRKDLEESDHGEIHEPVVEDGRGSVGQLNLINHFQEYVEILKAGKNLTLSRFYHLLKRDPMINKEDDSSSLKFPKSFQVLVKELFKRLDLNDDKTLSLDDFKILEKEGNLEKMEEFLEYQTARIEDYVEDLVESLHHNETIHEFEKRKMEEIRSARRFDEL